MLGMLREWTVSLRSQGARMLLALLLRVGSAAQPRLVPLLAALRSAAGELCSSNAQIVAMRSANASGSAAQLLQLRPGPSLSCYLVSVLDHHELTGLCTAFHQLWAEHEALSCCRRGGSAGGSACHTGAVLPGGRCAPARVAAPGAGAPPAARHPTAGPVGRPDGSERSAIRRASFCEQTLLSDGTLCQ